MDEKIIKSIELNMGDADIAKFYSLSEKKYYTYMMSLNPLIENCNVRKYKIVFRKKKSLYWLDESFSCNNISEIEHYINTRGNVRNKKIIKKWYQSRSSSYCWNENNYLYFVENILKEYFIMTQRQKVIYSYFVRDCAEVIISKNGTAEYRRYKSLEIEVGEICSFGNTILYLDATQSYDNIRKYVITHLKKYDWYYMFPLNKSLPKLGDISRPIECLMDPYASSSVVHEAIGHWAEADVFNLCKKHNLDYLNKRIFTCEANIIDYARHEDAAIEYYMDDCGDISRDIVVVENGYIKGLLSDQSEVINDNYIVGGNVRGGIESEFSMIRMKNLALLNGQFFKKDILKSIRKGLWILEFKDSKVDKNGLLHFVVGKGLYIVEGRPVERVESIILYQERIRLINSIDMIGNDGKWNGIISCTKNNSRVFLTHYAPSIKCKFYVGGLIGQLI